MMPVAGAVLGGAIAGPVGLVAGLKVGKIAAVSGGIIGNLCVFNCTSILFQLVFFSLHMLFVICCVKHGIPRDCCHVESPWECCHMESPRECCQMESPGNAVTWSPQECCQYSAYQCVHQCIVLCCL